MKKSVATMNYMNKMMVIHEENDRVEAKDDSFESMYPTINNVVVTA